MTTNERSMLRKLATAKPTDWTVPYGDVERDWCEALVELGYAEALESYVGSGRLYRATDAGREALS